MFPNASPTSDNIAAVIVVRRHKVYFPGACPTKPPWDEWPPEKPPDEWSLLCPSTAVSATAVTAAAVSATAATRRHSRRQHEDNAYQRKAEESLFSIHSNPPLIPLHYTKNKLLTITPYGGGAETRAGSLQVEAGQVRR